MIMSQMVGSRFLMDLIEMPPCDGHRHILQAVNHLSLCGFMAPFHGSLETNIVRRNRGATNSNIKF
jgi:hypothetical protein